MGGGYSHLQPLPQYTPVTGGNVKINKNHRKSEIVDTFLKMAHMKDERNSLYTGVEAEDACEEAVHLQQEDHQEEARTLDKDKN